MSDIVQVSYERVFNLGNYENERIALTATVAEHDDPEQVVLQLAQHACYYQKLIVAWRTEYDRAVVDLDDLIRQRRYIVSSLQLAQEQLSGLVEHLSGPVERLRPSGVDETDEIDEESDDDCPF